MSNRQPDAPPPVDDLLAPPPFGVAEATSEQLLPIPTSMEELLDTPEQELPDAPVAVPAKEPELPLAPRPAPPLEEHPPPVVAEAAPPRRSVAPIVLAAIVVLSLGAVFGWFLTSSAPAAPDTATQTAGATPSPPSSRVAKAALSSPNEQPAEDTPPQGTSPRSRTDFEAMTFEDRHAFLATTKDAVDVELHVGLDLRQADQSDDPCRTFADALDTIEAAESHAKYAWALEGVEPPDGSGPTCEGLDGRLEALRGAAPSSASATPQAPDRTPPRRSKPRRKTSRTRTPKTSPPPSTAPAPAKPASSPSIATKLDDDLRGLGD